jgi:hypothetical protein
VYTWFKQGSSCRLPCDRAEEVRGGYLEGQNQRRHAVLQYLEKIDARFETELQISQSSSWT